MMRMRTKTMGMGLGIPPTDSTAANGAGGTGGGVDGNWEMRPGGMLVQMRTDSDQYRPPPPTIRVRVKYGSVYHEININSQSSFGELKKMLSGPTGLHHQDQKLLFKDKERDSNAFLDTSGVKDKSKIVLVEDPISQERRYLEMRKTAKMEKAAKSISEISLEVDRLAGQVSALESVISRGGKVAEKDVLNLIELLMNQLLKLDGIIADGDVKLQRKMQVRRVQKYVETLDMLKVKNSAPISNGNAASLGNHIPMQQLSSPTQQLSSPVQQQQQRFSRDHLSSSVEQQQGRHSFGSPMQPQQQLQPSRHSASSHVLITTQWETFDSIPAPVPPGSKASTSTLGSAQPRFNWDLL
ncbi:BAG family molecular chaperone regulator 3-like [Coffea arabica]|uniref:BAG family molecular chaperone regulator 3-like n=1 Tax=Coffea arabica TaxID=13443 RepID=A0ABM4WRD8_COFAR